MQAILRDNLSGAMPIEIKLEKDGDSLVLHWEAIKADIVLPIGAVAEAISDE